MRLNLLSFFLTTLAICTPLIARGQDTFVQADTQRANRATIGYKMVRVPHTRILFPQLSRYRNRSVLRAVNRQIDELTKSFGCDVGFKKRYYEVRSRVEYAGNDIFSIYVSASWDCGGAYPTNDDNESVTFDLKTGKEVGFDQLFKDYEADKQEILQTIFAKQVERAKKFAAVGNQKSNDCEEAYSLEYLKEQEIAYNFAAAGLAVQPSWPHVTARCAERVIVPYSKLRKFAHSEGILFRAMED